MAVVHETPAGERTTVASSLEYAETTLEQLRGLTFRRSMPADAALIFPFDRPARRSVHTLFVRFDIDVCWLVDESVEQVRTLPAWRGLALGTADTIVEFPAGTAADVSPGDRLVFRE